MTLRFLCLSLTASVAAAAAVAPVHAADISTQSELVGDFNTQDTTPADNLEDLFNGLEDTGLDLALPSPTPDLLVPEASPLPSPEASPDIDIDTDLELYFCYKIIYNYFKFLYIHCSYQKIFQPLIPKVC